MKKLLVAILLIFAACGPGNYYEFSDLLNNSSKKCAIELKRGNIVISIKENAKPVYGYDKSQLESSQPGTKLSCAKDKNGDDNCAIFLFNPKENCFVISFSAERKKVEIFPQDLNDYTCILSPQLNNKILFESPGGSTRGVCMNE